MDKLRIAQINILNSSEGLEDRYRRLGLYLARVRPDIVAVQEVADPELLTASVQHFGFAHAYFAQPEYNDFDGKADSVGLLSKAPLNSLRELPFAETHRAGLIGELSIGRLHLAVASAHFAWGSAMEGVRLRQAELFNQEAEVFVSQSPRHRFVLAGDLNADEESRTVRFLQGFDLASDSRTSTYWTDAYRVAGSPALWATCEQSKGIIGPRTAARHGVELPEFLPSRRIDYIFTHGWQYGKLGGPLAYGRFGDPLFEGDLELSDHYGIWADLLV